METTGKKITACGHEWIVNKTKHHLWYMFVDSPRLYFSRSLKPITLQEMLVETPNIVYWTNPESALFGLHGYTQIENMLRHF